MTKIEIFTLPQPQTIKRGSILFDRPHFRQNHELDTARRLSLLGDDIIFLAETKIIHQKSPDILWRNQKWEIKRPHGKSADNINRALGSAIKQSSYIILDTVDLVEHLSRTVDRVCYFFRTYNKRSVASVIILTKNSYCLIDKDLV
jgi:hypothetical protein